MSDDLIKKEEAKEAVCKGCLKDWGLCHHHWDCPMLMNLEMLPSADVDVAPVKHGHWETKASHLADAIIYCSECETEYSFRDLLRVGEVDEFGHVIVPNCCPHCGAKMDEVK